MNLFDKASLILTPNADKVSKISSLKPTNGTGDFTFSRTGNATRVNSSGLIEAPRTNLLTYSEQFDNASWTKTTTTVSANIATSPDGTVSGDLVYPSSSGTDVRVQQSLSITSGVTYTTTIYAKASGINWIRLFAAPFTQGTYFNVSSGTIGTIGSGVTAAITSAGNGWYRCSVTQTAASTGTGYIYVNLTNGDGSGNVTANGTNGVLFWGAQVEASSTATDYIPTTTSARTTFAGITQNGTDASNIPRLNYPSGGGCPSILLEPARANLFLQSENTSLTPWGATGGSIVTNATSAPTGANTANKVAENTSTGQHYIQQQATVSTSTTYTISIFAKKEERDVIYIRCFNSTFGTIYTDVNYNLTTGVATGTSTKIEAYPNGWYRCSVTFTTASDPIINVRFNMTSSGNYNGITGYGMYMWGAQLEAGSYATSYIPTTTASVTRGGDLLSRSNIYTNGYITSDGGTWVVWLKNNLSLTRDNAQKSLYLADISGNNGLGLRNQGTSRLIVYKNISTAISNIFTTTSDTVKIAIKWNGTTADIFVNNNKVASNEIFSITQMENISSVLQVPFYIDFMALYPTPLTDAECAALTTL